MSVLAPITAAFEVKVGGAKLPAPIWSMLVAVEVDNRANAPDQCMLTFRDNRFTACDSSQLSIGKALEVSVSQRTAAGSGQLFKGEITALELDADETGTFFVVRAFDKSHRLHRGRKTRSFLNMKYSDIASRIAAELGLAYEGDDSMGVHEYVVQANVTNMEFLQQMAREVGFQVSVEGLFLRFAKPKANATAPPPGTRRMVSSPMQLVLNENLFRLNLAVTAHNQVKKVVVHGWNPQTKEPITATKNAPTSVAVTSAVGAPSALINDFGDAEFTAVGTPYRTQRSAQAAADGLAERLASASVSLVGMTHGDARLKSGKAVTISGAGTRMSGKYTLTATRHRWGPNEAYQTEIVASGAEDPSLLALAEGTGSESQRGVVNGVMPAIVTDNKDPNNLGRVKVKYPWMPKGGGQDLTSFWARVTNAWAGKDHGTFSLPEVEDEVLVAFENGDMRFPYIVGGLYNGKDKPKFTSDQMTKSGKTIKRGLWTREKHRLVFNDAPGTDEGIELSTGDDNYLVTLDQKNKKITVEAKDSGAVIAMKAGKDITIEAASGDLTLKAKGKIVLDATGDVNVTSKGNVKLDATMNAEIGGKAGLKATSNGIAEVKGTMVKIN